jgi:hypothetical protein
MTDDDLRERLDAWGQSSPPAVTDMFADNLESELRVRAAQRTGAAPRPIWRPLAGLVAASVLILAGYLATTRIATDNGTVVVLATSQDSTVILPDGTELDSPTSLDLPDGSRIEVGADGSASVNSVVLGAGSVAEIVDGRVEVLSQPAQPTTSTTSPATSAAPSTRPTTTSPPTTVRPTSTSQVDRTTSTPPNTRPTDPPPAAVDIELLATQTLRSEVVLEWTVTTADQIRGWEVQLRDGNRTVTIALLRDARARRLVVTRPDLESPTYVVIGLDRNGNAVAQSNPATVD